jgi:hypothetical protein
MTTDRKVSDVLQDIVKNVQDIVRSEVRLAKAELRQEASETARSGLWLATGVVLALSAWTLLVWSGVYALASVVPLWAAALAVGLVSAGVSALSIISGTRKFKRIHPIPERTVQTLKENVEWLKDSVK